MIAAMEIGAGLVLTATLLTVATVRAAFQPGYPVRSTGALGGVR